MKTNIIASAEALKREARSEDARYGSPPVTSEPLAHTCPTCGASKPRACAATTGNGETIAICMWMPQPLTPFEAERRRKFWVERDEELRDSIKMSA